MKKIFFILFSVLFSLASTAQDNVETQRQYLSGHGCDDMVEWDFYCTDGRNSKKWTKIGVPSCWELQGFGTYQYGIRFYGKAEAEGIADEKGLYKYEFELPQAWEGSQIELVFEAVMTDAKVTINGRKAGSGQHQGGFSRFSFDVSDRIFFGKKKNRLEVEVSKESANSQVNLAERRADYWNFGGIFRPVFIVRKPVLNIDRVAIDAGMDGRFQADCYLSRAVNGGRVKTEILDSRGEVVASNNVSARGSDHATIDFKVNSPKLWTAETPNRYTAVFSLTDASGKLLHCERQPFGFRTIEYRASDGVYINGKKVIFKGVNRHSFRPETGRTLSKAKNIEDVELIKSMNMNSVRLSHYPADPEFLDACDSLGLYVMNELSGWHAAHSTIVGKQLVRELVARDQNHPSIIFWSNGNEGGFNYELEPDFHFWDKQKRVVLYPWANRNGFETKHYRSWGETQDYMRQPEIFLPTEFLHGLYDGGHGAGLRDYWQMMMSNERCAGGFLWDMADQGVVRTDLNNIIDCMGNFAADGIVGPHFEKEGSYYTIRQIWSPIQIVLKEQPSKANGNQWKFGIENHYNFNNLNSCTFSYRFLRFPQPGNSKTAVVANGRWNGIQGEPGTVAEKALAEKDGADAVEIKVTDAFGKELFTWVFAKDTPKSPSPTPGVTIKPTEKDSTYSIEAGGRTYEFNTTNGRLNKVLVGNKILSLHNGPRFVAARRSDRSYDQFYNHDDKEAEKKKTLYTEYVDQGKFAGFEIKNTRQGQVLVAKYNHGCLKETTWKFHEDGSATLDYLYHFGGVVDEMGITFDYPETQVKAKSWVGKGPNRVWQNRLDGPQLGYWHNKYNDPIPGESWDYPEFKGYFADTKWMQIETNEGKITLIPAHPMHVGVYTPRDGRDGLLYTLPETDITLWQVIPAVRNKVNTTDLNGPSAQPYWAKNEEFKGSVKLMFE